MLARSFFFLLISEVLYNLSGYIIHSGMGRILGPTDYGRYAVVITLTTMIIILIGNGIPTAMSKYLSEVFEKEKGKVPVIKNQAKRLQFFLIGGVALLFFLCAPLIARILGDPGMTELFQLSSLIIPAFAMASFYFYYYTGIHEFKVQSFLKILRSVARMFFIIGLAWLYKSSGRAIEGAIVGYALAPLAVFLGAQFFDPFRKTEPKGTFPVKKLFNYAWPVTLFLIAYEFLVTIDLYLVKGLLKSDYLTGIYNAAITVGRIPYYLFYALTILILPAVSKSTADEDHGQTKKLVSESFRLLFLALLPICLLMSVFADPIVRIFYSQKFIEAVPPMQIFVFGVGFLTVFYVATFILNGAGKVKVPMLISLLGLALNTILTYFLIQKYALMGAAWGTTLTSFFVMLLSLAYVRKHFGYIFSLKSFLKISGAFAILVGISWFLPRTGWLFLILGPLCLAFYLFLLYLGGEIGAKEWNLLKEMMKRKKKNS